MACFLFECKKLDDINQNQQIKVMSNAKVDRDPHLIAFIDEILQIPTEVHEPRVCHVNVYLIFMQCSLQHERKQAIKLNEGVVASQIHFEKTDDRFWNH